MDKTVPTALDFFTNALLAIRASSHGNSKVADFLEDMDDENPVYGEDWE